MNDIPVTFWLSQALNDQNTDLRNALQELAAAGGKYAVLSHSWISAIMLDHKLAKVLEKLLAECNITLHDCHSPFGGVLDLNVPEQSLRRQMLLRHKLAMEIAASFGVKTITIHPGSDRFFPEIPLVKHLDLMRASLDELVPYAEKCDMVIAIENSLSRAASPEKVVLLKNEYKSKHLGLCYDSGHANQLDNGRYMPNGTIWKYWQMVGVPEPAWQDNRTILESMLPAMVNCHLHDNDGSDDSHSIPGEGNTPWQLVMEMLKKAPRLQSVQCEVKIDPRYTITQVCSKFKELGLLA